jgi:hypothetical protein
MRPDLSKHFDIGGLVDTGKCDSKEAHGFRGLRLAVSG